MLEKKLAYTGLDAGLFDGFGNLSGDVVGATSCGRKS